MKAFSNGGNITLASALALFCGLAAILPAGAGKRGGFDPQEIAERMVERIDDRLDLSAAQREEIEGLIANAAGQVQQQRRRISEEAAATFAGDSFSEQDAQRMLDRAEETRKMRRRIMAQAMVQLHGILTPEQRRQAGEMLAAHGGWLAGHGLSGERSRRGGWHHDDDHHHRRWHR